MTPKGVDVAFYKGKKKEEQDENCAASIAVQFIKHWNAAYMHNAQNV